MRWSERQNTPFSFRDEKKHKSSGGNFAVQIFPWPKNKIVASWSHERLKENAKWAISDEILVKRFSLNLFC